MKTLTAPCESEVDGTESETSPRLGAESELWLEPIASAFLFMPGDRPRPETRARRPDEGCRRALISGAVSENTTACDDKTRRYSYPRTRKCQHSG